MHTSGAHGIGVLEAAQAQGALPIALHPAMTFSGTSMDLSRLEMCPAAITATPVSLPIATALAYEMGMEPTVAEEEDRPLPAALHTARTTWSPWSPRQWTPSKMRESKTRPYI